MKKLLFATSIVLAVFLPHSVLWAKDDCKSRLVTSEASVTILNNDTEMAKDRATDMALRRAAEQAGIKIDTQTIVSMGLTLSDWIRIKASGYVKDWTLLPDSGITNGTYKAKIQAWIKCGKEEKNLDRNLLSPKKILLISTGQGSTSVEKSLKQKLNTLGYRYHDSKFIQQNVSPETWNNLTHQRIMNLDKDTFKFMADLIIHTRSSIEKLNQSTDPPGAWFKGQATVLLYQISGKKRGEPIIEATAESEKLFGKGKNEAEQKHNTLVTGHPNGFKRKVADPVVSSFTERLTSGRIFKTKNREIRLTITNVPSRREFNEFLHTLKEILRPVRGTATEQSQNRNAYTLHVKYPMKIIYLAHLIAANRKYKLIRHEWDRIEVEYVIK